MKPILFETSATSVNAVLSALEEIAKGLVKGAIVLAVGLLLAKWLMRLLKKTKGFQRANSQSGGFFGSLFSTILNIVVVLTALGAMGVPLSSIVTILGAAGVAISLGVQGAISNFVGGIIILTQKLFTAGDYIKVGTSEGTVQKIGTFYTTLITYDNIKVSLPNSSLSNTAVINCSTEQKRMVEVSFYVAYDADIDKARDVLLGVVKESGLDASDETHKPAVIVGTLHEYSIQLNLRCWAVQKDFWPLKYYVSEEGKKALDKAGIKARSEQTYLYLRQ